MADELFAAALQAMRQAHVPYSHFPVGAAIRTASGEVYAGCNVENASFPEGWCAETSAIAHMILAGGRSIAEVSAHQPSGKLAFSTLHPAYISPLTVRIAAPTGKFE